MTNSRKSMQLTSKDSDKFYKSKLWKKSPKVISTEMSKKKFSHLTRIYWPGSNKQPKETLWSTDITPKCLSKSLMRRVHFVHNHNLKRCNLMMLKLTLIFDWQDIWMTFYLKRSTKIRILSESDDNNWKIWENLNLLSLSESSIQNDTMRKLFNQINRL